MAPFPPTMTPTTRGVKSATEYNTRGIDGKVRPIRFERPERVTIVRCPQWDWYLPVIYLEEV